MIHEVLFPAVSTDVGQLVQVKVEKTMEGSIKPQAVKYWCYALAYTDLKQVLVGVILVEHTGDSKKYTH